MTTYTDSLPNATPTASSDPLAYVKADELRVLIIDLDTIFDVVNFGRQDEAVRLTTNEADFIADTIRMAVGFLSDLRERQNNGGGV